VERLWRSVKYENLYLNAYGTIPEAKAGLTSYFKFYNQKDLIKALTAKHQMKSTSVT